MFLGLIIVLVSGALIFNYFQKKGGDISLDGLTDTVLEEPTPTYIDIGDQNISVKPTAGQAATITPGIATNNENQVVYKVKKGDSLWKIAEAKYGDGNKWKQLAQINGIKNPGQINENQEIKLLDNPDGKGNEITGDTYIVESGDSLSKIAQRAYGDINSWTKIFEANKDKISNPNLIFRGTSLKIPR